MNALIPPHTLTFIVLDTESDSSLPPSKGVSFAFSNIESRNGSVTSLSSTASVDSRTGKKRTLDYSDTRTPIAGATNSCKAARTAQKVDGLYHPLFTMTDVLALDPTAYSIVSSASCSSNPIPVFTCEGYTVRLP